MRVFFVVLLIVSIIPIAWGGYGRSGGGEVVLPSNTRYLRIVVYPNGYVQLVNVAFEHTYNETDKQGWVAFIFQYNYSDTSVTCKTIIQPFVEYFLGLLSTPFSFCTID
ncbi:MAG: hypothetical protein B6U89_04595 [Desulfurococcales archaeon ex4484_58]|nr:MAG: hypothetical protein B6U89_04595 [Desulfurococcales archaeon ex4484_58]